MTKAITKPTAPESAVTTDVKIDLNQSHIKEAIAKGLSLIKEGKTKADATRAMFPTLKDEPQEVVVAAFVEGATLTPKGALTYWYNCRRKMPK